MGKCDALDSFYANLRNGFASDIFTLAKHNRTALDIAMDLPREHTTITVVARCSTRNQEFSARELDLARLPPFRIDKVKPQLGADLAAQQDETLVKTLACGWHVVDLLEDQPCRQSCPRSGGIREHLGYADFQFLTPR